VAVDVGVERCLDQVDDVTYVDVRPVVTSPRIRVLDVLRVAAGVLLGQLNPRRADGGDTDTVPSCDCLADLLGDDLREAVGVFGAQRVCLRYRQFVGDRRLRREKEAVDAVRRRLDDVRTDATGGRQDVVRGERVVPVQLGPGVRATGMAAQ
jgi:hypothetical protein